MIPTAIERHWHWLTILTNYCYSVIGIDWSDYRPSDTADTLRYYYGIEGYIGRLCESHWWPLRLLDTLLVTVMMTPDLYTVHYSSWYKPGYWRYWFITVLIYCAVVIVIDVMKHDLADLLMTVEGYWPAYDLPVTVIPCSITLLNIIIGLIMVLADHIGYWRWPIRYYYYFGWPPSSLGYYW